MASRRVRSKGCEQCRRRRVKCDEIGDFCGQCVRFGLECSGPVRGITIIDMTPESQYPLERVGTPLDKRPKRIRKTSKQGLKTPAPKHGSTEVSNDLNIRSESSEFKYQHKDQKSFSADVVRSRDLIFTYQPSSAAAAEQFLVSQFLSFSQPNAPRNIERSWLISLPDWMASSQVPVFRYAVRAMTTALHAKIHNNISARTESYRWYIITLNKFRSYLGDRTKKGSKDDEAFVPGHEEILVPTCLFLFEALSHKQSKDVLQHLVAACKILELRGPEGCKAGLFHQMFITYRTSSSLISLISGRPSIFAAEEWHDIPFEEKGKTLFHQLVDIVLSIPILLQQAGLVGRIDLAISNISQSEKIPLGLEQSCLQLLQQLERWWNMYLTTPPDLRNLFSNLTSTTLPLPTASTPEIGQQSDLGPSPTFAVQQDEATCFTVSLYNGITFIIHTVLHALCSQRLDTPGCSSEDLKHHLSKIDQHCESVLIISSYHPLRRRNGMDFLRSTFPLKLLELLGPAEQALQANKFITQYHGEGAGQKMFKQ